MAKETDDYREHSQTAANAPDGGRLFNVALGITPRRRPFLMVLALMAVASLVLPGCSNETPATDGQAAAVEFLRQFHRPRAPTSSRRCHSRAPSRACSAANHPPPK